MIRLIMLTALMFFFFISSVLLEEYVQLNCQSKSEIKQLTLQNDLDTLLNWFPGEYDNHQQVYEEFMTDILPQERHRQTHHIFYPVELTFIPGKLLYAEQSQHYNREDIYRQRIYSFEEDEIGLHRDNSKLQFLSQDDFILKPGCEVYWKRVEDEFQGYLKDNACSYFSERFDKRVYLNETLILRRGALLLDDAAVDEYGIPVFGVHNKGPTINKKEIDCR